MARWYGREAGYWSEVIEILGEIKGFDLRPVSDTPIIWVRVMEAGVDSAVGLEPAHALIIC